MKTESENVQRWDDIIFENRNKAYGAYAIRKSYDDNVLTGLTISLSVGCLIFFSSFLSVKEKTSIVEIPDGTFYPMPPPDFKPVITAKTPPTAPKPFKKDLFPIATTKVDVPDEKVVEPTIPESPGGTVSTVNPEDGLGQSGASIGDEVIPEPPKPPFVLYAEHMPAYEGGSEAMMKFLQRKLRYPPIAERNRIEGIAYISFIISSTGKVTNVKVMKGISNECDKEAVRVISMMDKWSPGLHNKMPVAVKLVLPIKFKLDS